MTASSDKFEAERLPFASNLTFLVSVIAWAIVSASF